MDWDHTADFTGWQIVCPICVLQHALATQMRTHANTHVHLIYTLMAKGVMITIETQFSDNHANSSILLSPLNCIAFQTCSQCSTALMIGSLYFELPLNISFTFGEFWDSLSHGLKRDNRSSTHSCLGGKLNDIVRNSEFVEIYWKFRI